MNTKSFKDFLSSSGPDKPRSPAKSRAERLAKVVPQVMAEVLEARRLYAVTSGMAGSVLVVTGTSGAESIDVWGDATYLYVDEAGGSGGPQYPIANITRVDVSAGAGNDTVNLWGSGGGAFSIHCAGRVYGEDGNDSLDGGSFADSIFGGVGYDTVHGWDGNDTIYGGTGSGADSDSVTGYDSLFGDGTYASGNDFIYGEGGGDTIDGGDGGDYLSGGDFGDSILGGDGDDSLHGNDGGDTLVGGGGADGMFGNEGDDYIDALEPSDVGDVLDGGNGNDCGWWEEGIDDDTNMEGNLA